MRDFTGVDERQPKQDAVKANCNHGSWLKEASRKQSVLLSLAAATAVPPSERPAGINQGARAPFYRRVSSEAHPISREPAQLPDCTQDGTNPYLNVCRLIYCLDCGTTAIWLFLEVG
jgi:hypothetical protein